MDDIILKPSILTHPNIPKPLHGLSPREVKGKEWWDMTRKAAYKIGNNKCWACGIHRSEAKYHQWLEGHENYHINYEEGWMEITEITALCHCCHSFIHSGRLRVLYQKGVISADCCKYILQRGFCILKKAHLEPFGGTAWFYADEFGNDRFKSKLKSKATELMGKQTTFKIQQDWTKWHLKLDGKEYYSKFKNIIEWSAYYE